MKGKHCEFWIQLNPDTAVRIHATTFESAPGNAGEPDIERAPEGMEIIQILKGLKLEQISRTNPL